MDKATETILNQGITGSIAIIFLIALVFIFKLLLKEKDLRIRELQERISERKDDTHQTFMDYLSTVHTLVENSTKTVERFADIVAPLKVFLEMLINSKNKNL